MESDKGVQPFSMLLSLERSGDQLALYCDDATILSEGISPDSSPKGSLQSKSEGGVEKSERERKRKVS